MMLECQSCRGRYAPIQSDGTRYFHRCPPLSSAELRAAIAANASPLSADQAKQLAAIDKAAPVTADDPKGQAPGDAYLAGLALERANLRDENVDLAKVKAALRADAKLTAAQLDPDAIAKAVGDGALELVPVNGA